MTAEVERLRVHFADVDRELRRRSDPTRKRHLDRLAAYARAGRFPRNDYAPVHTPCFIDARGARCAVAELLFRDGREALARRIAARDNHALLGDMQDAELAAWVEGSGLTLEELAWIQPGYAPDWDDQRLCDADCQVVCEAYAAAYEWTGQALAPVMMASTEERPTHVAVAADGSVWGVSTMTRLGRWQDGAWAWMGSPGQARLTSVWLGSDGALWTLGDEVGRHVTPDAKGTAVETSERPRREAAWGVGGEMWFTGGGNDVLHVTAAANSVWTFARSAVVVERGTIYMAAGTARDDVWFSGHMGLVHWDGKHASELDMSVVVPERRGYVKAVWAPRKGEVWAGGSDLIHWQDGTLRAFDLERERWTTRIKSIWGSSPTDVWAVGEREVYDRTDKKGVYLSQAATGVAFHWNGTSWKSIAVPDIPFDQVLAGPGGRPWLVPAGGCVRQATQSSCVDSRRAACERVHRPVPAPRAVAGPKREPPPILDPVAERPVRAALTQVGDPVIGPVGVVQTPRPKGSTTTKPKPKPRATTPPLAPPEKVLPPPAVSSPKYPAWMILGAGGLSGLMIGILLWQWFHRRRD